MTNQNQNLQKLVASSYGDKDMIDACNKQVFYVVATPCMRAGYSIGTMDSELPNLMATLQEAETENQDMAELYQADIEAGEREEGDIWDGEVFIATWKGIGDISLYSTSDDVISKNALHTDDWKVLCGL